MSDLMRRINFGPIQPSIFGTSLGYESMFNELDRILEATKSPSNQPSDKYPPHNIIKLDDYNYVIELAIAGFTKSDIDITVADGTVTIKGEKNPTKEEEEFLSNVQYMHKGISTRSFTKIIRITDTIEVLGAEYDNGILRIKLENVIPESKKPRKISIANGTLPLVEPGTKQLLTES
jgi:molecular chaperone IbpA